MIDSENRKINIVYISYYNMNKLALLLFVFLITSSFLVSGELTIPYDDDTIPRVILDPSVIIYGNVTNYYNTTGAADGNASSICAGDEVLLGNGSCRASSDFAGGGDFVFATGDNMTGDLNLSANDIYDVGDITIRQFIKGEFGGIMDISGDPWSLSGTNFEVVNNITANWFFGLFDWFVDTDSNNWLTFNGSTLWFNETYLNTTIANVISDQGLGGNYSWNETRADELYSDIIWGYNQSLAVSNMWNETWSSTYNATYDALIGASSGLWETNGSAIFNNTVINIGIRTAEPNATLDVNGTIQAHQVNTNIVKSTNSSSYMEIDASGVFTFWAE